MDPKEFWNKAKSELVRRLMDRALEFRNPTKMGKDSQTYKTCFDGAKLIWQDYMLQEKLN